MSVKIKNVTKNQDIEIKEFFEMITFSEDRKKYLLVDQNMSELNVNFIVKGCSIKYTPEKYDKISITLDQEASSFFDKLQEKIKQDDEDYEGVCIQNMVKDKTIGLKLTKDQKAQINKSYKKGDSVDVVIHFNNIWLVNDKHYVSLELVQIRPGEVKEEKVIDYFE